MNGNFIVPTRPSGDSTNAAASTAFVIDAAGLSVTNVGDTDYTILPTDHVVNAVAAFTAPRTWTLPDTSTVNSGSPLTIVAGSPSATNTLTVLASGTDQIFYSTRQISVGQHTVSQPEVIHLFAVAGFWVVLSENNASMVLPDQILAGGAHVTSLSLSAGNVTIDPGDRPLQFIANSGAFTITAPSNDGSCILLVTNDASAGAITFSGFTVGDNVGDDLTTTDGDMFSISIWRINGVSGYRVAAHQ